VTSISYIRAAQVGVVAVAADLIFNQGRTLSGIALGAIGSFGLQVCKKISDANVKRNYRIYPPQDFSPESNEQSLKSALTRVQAEHPLIYQRYLKTHEVSTQDEALAHFKEKLKEGVCYGRATVLLKPGQPFSIQQNMSSMKAEEAYYYQIVQSLHISASSYLRNADLEMNIENMEQRLKIILGESFEEMLARGDRAMDSQAALNHLKMDDPISTFATSSSFTVQAPPEIYQRIFEKSIEKSGIPKRADIVGVIDLPKHVIAFQYGPKGYFLYDPFSIDKGLFQYPDKATFFQSLREHALYDVQRSKYMALEKDKVSPEEILKDADTLVWQAEASFRFKAL
jgi:hypothetical protein